jgi:hypothetical protein
MTMKAAVILAMTAACLATIAGGPTVQRSRRSGPSRSSIPRWSIRAIYQRRGLGDKTRSRASNYERLLKTIPVSGSRGCERNAVRSLIPNSIRAA